MRKSLIAIVATLAFMPVAYGDWEAKPFRAGDLTRLSYQFAVPVKTKCDDTVAFSSPTGKVQYRHVKVGDFDAYVECMQTIAPPPPPPDPVPSPSADVYRLSPTGSDTADCKAAPCKTFARVFALLPAGGELVLDDGTYGTATGTGYLNWQGTGSAQVPSGTAARPTIVRARNPGNVFIRGGAGDNNGPLLVGRSSRKDSYIRFQDITFLGQAKLFNTSYVTMKNCGVNGNFAVGTNDHDNGNDDNLIEDVWVWASGERVIAINYRAHRNVWRRVLVRGDGCGTSACAGSGNPNVGFTVYDSHDVSVQNVLVIDRILAPPTVGADGNPVRDTGDSPYSDFAIAQHTNDVRYYFGRNEWLGTISLNSPDVGYYMEPDAGATLDPTITLRNAIAWNSARGGFNFARSGTNLLLENLTVSTRSDAGVRVAPEMTTGVLRNVSINGTSQFAFNSRFVPTYVNIFGTFTERYKDNLYPCTVGCLSADPQFARLTETSAALKGKGLNGADIGANVLLRYGLNGGRFGEPGYNVLTQAPLWPWPNEERIQREMCASTTRGFCSAPSLTQYVQNFGR